MPELPEVETIRQGLAQAVIGRRVVRVTLKRPDFIREGSSRRSRIGAISPDDLLEGQTITRIERRGKQIAVIGSQDTALCLHLGMSGSLAAGPADALQPTPHTHIRWDLDENSAFQMTDPRRFGGVWAFTNLQELTATRWSTLGPDALTVTARQLQTALKTTKRAIKAALLDQTLLAGVGNIYADESLHRAQIHPQTPAHRLQTDPIKSLATNLRQILREAITAGGSSLRDHVMLNGAAGSFQFAHRVYGRGGLPCQRCGAELRKTLIAQRTTVWCATCQPKERTRKKRINHLT
ncbi:MAG: bifunctional DNA-formamidopyrimidine glycosylase/DNA-(apurinic or apyrimidinic site) lyase [Phycisphaeraceae bacterium]